MMGIPLDETVTAEETNSWTVMMLILTFMIGDKKEIEVSVVKQ